MMNLLLPAGASSTVTTDDGAALAVTVAGSGSGPTVVLAHGWTCRREFWALVAERLIAAGHQVVLYDQRGHGSSTSGSDGCTITRLGADLRAVLEAVHARGAVVVGHSMGGMGVLALAADDPATFSERVGAVALVSTRASRTESTGARRWAAAVLGSRWFAWLMHGPLGRRLVRRSFGRASGTDLHDIVRGLFTATDAVPRRAFVEAMQQMTVEAGLARIHVPTVVVTGSVDSLVATSFSDEIVAGIPGARLIRLDGLGHQLPLEAPDELASIITDLVRAP